MVTLEEKKVVALVAKGNRLTIRAIPATKLFVPETRYNKKSHNYFKNATFIAKYDVILILFFGFDRK